MGVETNSSARLAERISKATWGLSLRKLESRSFFHELWLLLLIIKTFLNLKTLYNRLEVSLEIIWNLDETGANTADIFYMH